MSGYFEVKFAQDVHTLTRFCVPEEQNTKAGEFQIEDVNFNLGEALQNHYPLLDLVFRFLDEKTLNQVLLVSTIWKDVAERELRKRTWPSWVTYNNNCPNVSLYQSKGFNCNHVALALYVYNQQRIKLEQQMCVHSKAGDKKESFVEYLEEIGCKHYCVIACSAVSPIVDICDSVFQGVLLPHIPNVRTTIFEFSHSKPDLSQFIKEHEQIKACLVFTKKYTARNIETLFSNLLKGQSHQTVALGGGIVNCKKSLRMPENQRLKDHNLMCIAFLQQAECNFRAYSVVIVNNGGDREGFSKEMTRFRKMTKELYTYGIIFRFCCKAKYFKGEETDVIYRLYPGYIVFGMDVEGEIGWNSFDMSGKEKYPLKKKRKRLFPQILNDWTSVLVLITWGNRLKEDVE